MKVARFYAPGDIRLEDVAEPTPGPDEVMIRVRNCSTCGTDVKIIRNGHHHMTPPQVMGHEIAGEIVEVGADVGGWSAGDRVQVIAAIPCGACAECRAGRMTVCPNQTSMGYHYDGGFAEYMSCRAPCWPSTGSTASRTGVSFAEASVAEPWRACSTARSWPGSATATTSWSSVRARSAACTCAWPGRAARPGVPRRPQPRAARQAADAGPARRRDLRRRDRPRRRRLELTDGRGVDVVITAAAAGAAQEQALQMLARRAG